MTLGEPIGQGWLQINELGLAFLLSALIGLEREIRQKSAGLRTYTLVGLASALIFLISKYGFINILDPGKIVVDPSRVAAQVVSGIGFIGGGVIFVRKDIVRGLTTAATVWLTSAVGMACAAGLPVLAIGVTICHFVVISLFPYLEMRLPKSRWAPTRLQIAYEDGRGILRQILTMCTQKHLAVTHIQVDQHADEGFASGKQTGKLLAQDNAASLSKDGASANKMVKVVLEVTGVGSLAKLMAKLSGISGVMAVGPYEGEFAE